MKKNAVRMGNNTAPDQIALLQSLIWVKMFGMAHLSQYMGPIPVSNWSEIHVTRNLEDKISQFFRCFSTKLIS